MLITAGLALSSISLAESDNGDVDIGHLSVGWLDESLCYTPHGRVNARAPQHQSPDARRAAQPPPWAGEAAQTGLGAFPLCRVAGWVVIRSATLAREGSTGSCRSWSTTESYRGGARCAGSAVEWIVVSLLAIATSAGE